MKYRVAVEEYMYHGVYVEANSPEEAEAIVQKMIDDYEYIKYDDDGEGDIRVVDGETKKWNEETGYWDW